MGSKDKKLFYENEFGILNASSDASWGNAENGKSFSGGVVLLGKISTHKHLNYFLRWRTIDRRESGQFSSVDGSIVTRGPESSLPDMESIPNKWYWQPERTPKATTMELHLHMIVTWH
ncbi:hypothetical protein TNCV_468931 [Trichonephila clavipes]|nr:hypothetical protein TNCV_468931 [Trichonephila clavipes]